MTSRYAENLDLPLQYRDVAARERAARVADLLDRFQIVGKKDLYPGAALRRPAATGRGCARGDHAATPAAGRRADRRAAFQPGKGMIMDLLHQLHAEGTSIIQVTHNEAFANEAQRVIRLQDGWVETGGVSSGQTG
jgi:ABC-type lipoprotein export system ATPase subunit